MLNNPSNEVKHIVQLNDRHIKLYSCIKRYCKENGHSPSLRELSELSGIGLSSINSYLAALESLGYIKRKPSRSRSIKVL